MEFSISLPADADGYVTFQCPYCNSRFKLSADEYQDEEKPFDELCCPYCGLSHDKSRFFSDDVIDVATTMAKNYAIELINESFGKIAHDTRNSFVKMTFNPMKSEDVKKLNENETEETEFKCPYCDRHVKVVYCIGESKTYCPYCGVDLI